MKMIIAMLASTAAVAFSSGIVPTVLIAGGIRVNKEDFDADQELPEGDRQYKPYNGKKVAQPSGGEGSPDIEATAAPSAPDFSSPSSSEGEQAAAPNGVDPEVWLKQKRGSGAKAKWYIVDSKGEDVAHPLVPKDGYADEKSVDAAISTIDRNMGSA